MPGGRGAFLHRTARGGKVRRQFMSTFDTDTLLQLARDALAAHCAVLFLPEPDGRFVLAASACEGSPATVPAAVAPGKGLVGWILRNRQPLVVNNFDPLHSRLGYYEEKEEGNIAAFMGFPLPGGGALCVDCLEPREFNRREQRVLQRLALLLNAGEETTEKQREVGDAAHYFEQMEPLCEISARRPHWKAYLASFLQLTAETTGFDYVCFASLPEGSSLYTIEGESAPLLLEGETPARLPLSSGVVGWVFRNEGLPFYAEGLDGSPAAPLFGKSAAVPDFQSAVCLPVTMNQATCGVLCFAGLEPRSMPEEMRAFVRIAARSLGRHLELLYLRHRVQTLLPRAQIHLDGAPAFDPDTAPVPHLNEDD